MHSPVLDAVGGGGLVNTGAAGNQNFVSYNVAAGGQQVRVAADGNMNRLEFNGVNGGQLQNVYANGNMNQVSYNQLGAGYASMLLLFAMRFVCFRISSLTPNLDYITAIGNMNNVETNVLSGGEENYIRADGMNNQVRFSRATTGTSQFSVGLHYIARWWICQRCWRCGQSQLYRRQCGGWRRLRFGGYYW